jgi:hypothetical protein
MPSLLFAMSLLLSVQGQSDWTPETPVRILLNITQDPSKTARVTWRTMKSAPQPVAQIALSSPDPRFTTSARTVAAQTTVVDLPAGGQATYYQADFSNLEPDTAYTYRVGSEGNFSEWIDIRTASDKPKDFSFIYFGDAQNDVKSMWSRVIRKSYKEQPNAAFLLHAGDLINKANADNEWGEWFYAGGWIHGSIPTVATPGNHEYTSNAAKELELSKFWNPQFSMPENGISGLERTNYFFDYQGARFISMNSNVRIEDQTAWLEQTLKSNPHKWSFISQHHPIFSTAGERDNPKIRSQWESIIRKYNVAIVLQGHDHTYARYNVPTGMQGQDKQSGTVYTVSVSGPKMYRLGNAKTFMNRLAEYTQLYQIVRVSQAKVRYEAYTATGELYDAFELSKNSNGTNKFIEVKVNSKQRLEAEKAAKLAAKLGAKVVHSHGKKKHIH